MNLTDTSSPGQLNGRIASIVGIDQVVLIENIRDLSIEADKLKAASELMGEQTKDVRDTATLRYYGRHYDKHKKYPSMTLAEKHGQTSESLRDHLLDVENAKLEASRARAEYFAARNALDVSREHVRFATQEMRLA